MAPATACMCLSMTSDHKTSLKKIYSLGMQSWKLEKQLNNKNTVLICANKYGCWQDQGLYYKLCNNPSLTELLYHESCMLRHCGHIHNTPLQNILQSIQPLNTWYDLKSLEKGRKGARKKTQIENPILSPILCIMGHHVSEALRASGPFQQLLLGLDDFRQGSSATRREQQPLDKDEEIFVSATEH